MAACCPGRRSRRRSPRRAACRKASIASRRPRHSAFSTPIEMMHFIAELRDLSRRQAGRLQALHRPSVGIHGDLQGDDRDRHPRRFRRRRRQGRRHRRGAAGIHRSCRHAAARRPELCAQCPGRRGPARRHPHRRRGPHHHRLRHRARLGAGRRLVQRRARLHVRAGLHPIAIAATPTVARAASRRRTRCARRP